MSTRCQIVVEGSNVVIYRHGDGYPEGKNGVVAALKKIVPQFVAARGFDEVYMPAHIVSSMIVDHHKTFGADSPYHFLGFGIEGYENPNSGFALHGDIEFLYVVKKNGTIEVRSCFNDPNGPDNIGNTKVIKTVKYKLPKVAV